MLLVSLQPLTTTYAFKQSNVIKLFCVTYKLYKQSRVFVPGKQLQPSLMFEVKFNSGLCHGGTVVEHSTHDQNIKGSNPATHTSGLYHKSFTIVICDCKV